jgi:hypothetical protein
MSLNSSSVVLHDGTCPNCRSVLIRADPRESSRTAFRLRFHETALGAALRSYQLSLVEAAVRHREIAAISAAVQSQRLAHSVRDALQRGTDAAAGDSNRE